MSESNEKMLAKYKVFSKTYDNLFYLFERTVFSQKGMDPRAALVRKIAGSNLQVLDVCCGTGRDSIAIARSDGSNTITGVDLSPDMLARANRKARKLGLKNASFHQMDATRLRFQDEEFDVIVSSFALHEMDYDLMVTALKEMLRVLKAGGTAYLVDYGREEVFLSQWLFAAYLKLSYPRRVREFLDHDWNQILTSTGFRMDSIERYRASRLICATK